MHYLSTRGRAPALDFEQATMAGLAADGGLYVPEAWPALSADEIRGLRGLDYAQLAQRLLARFVGDSIDADTLARLSAESYRGFSPPGHSTAAAHSTVDPAPLTALDDSLYVLELFHGPTLAFKDFALQFLGRLFGHFLGRRGQTCTILGATSGDTGSAAIEALRGIEAVTLYMLHPRGRVSEVQRRQMTTVLDANIHNLAVDGDFDDCQRLVKALFSDDEFRARHALAAVNSINWARIAAQVIYYFYAALQLGAPARAVNFAVPTGNFGNVFAGYVARRMGLPVERLIIGCNRNDILARFFDSGIMRRRKLHATISPSMDIQVSSNFERYLFDVLGRDGEQVRDLMTVFAARGEFTVAPEVHRRAAELIRAHRLTDAQTRAQIADTHRRNGILLDPHSAIGVAAARACGDGPGDGAPTVALATAHPAKFDDAVAAACGVGPEWPPRLRDILQREERVTTVANDAAEVKALMERGESGGRRRGDGRGRGRGPGGRSA